MQNKPNTDSINNIVPYRYASHSTIYLTASVQAYHYKTAFSKGCAERYKFGFNGQNKDDEIYGEGNTYSAQYWEYVARLGRRWNLDPKPNPSVSWYSTFANNPIWYSDPMGDTARVSWKGRFGIQRNASYIDGNWKYDKSGKNVTTRFVKDKKAQQMMNAYSNLNKIKDLDPLTTAINSAPNSIFLFNQGDPETNQSAFDYKDYYEQITNGVQNPNMNVFAQMEINPNQSIFEGPFYNAVMSSLEVVLTHELGHVKDALENMPIGFMQPSEKASDAGSATEINAMYWENVYRINSNLPLRLNYNNPQYAWSQRHAMVRIIDSVYLIESNSESQIIELRSASGDNLVKFRFI